MREATGRQHQERLQARLDAEPDHARERTRRELEAKRNALKPKGAASATTAGTKGPTTAPTTTATKGPFSDSTGKSPATVEDTNDITGPQPEQPEKPTNARRAYDFGGMNSHV